MRPNRLIAGIILVSGSLLPWVSGQHINPLTNEPMLGENVFELRQECEGRNCSQEEVEEAYEEDKQEQEEMAEPAIIWAPSFGVDISLGD